MDSQDKEKLNQACGLIIDVSNNYIGSGEQDYLMKTVERIEELVKNSE